jgi:hypothetical protein
MRNVVKIIAASLVTVAFGLMVGCGGDGGSSPTPTGTVVKGPVSGATDTDSTGKVIGITDANGKFPLTGTGPYSTSGGKYTPLNADGTAGTPVNAPSMMAPAGVSQITPLSTLVANEPDKAKQDQILATLAKMGVNLNTDLSTKTSANSAALILNETVGAVLTTAASSPALLDKVMTTLAAAVAGLSTSATVPDVTAITQSITTAIKEDPALATIQTALTTSASTAAEGADKKALGPMPAPPAPPAPTGSTGGTT